MDYDGLQEDVAGLITGARIHVNPSGFQDDLEYFRNKDDILTILVHLDYLTCPGTAVMKLPISRIRSSGRGF